jgi:cardiolipin synthase
MSRRRKRRKKLPSWSPDGAHGDFSWSAYCRYPSAMSSGNEVELLVDGEQAFPEMLEAIAEARQTVVMDSYIFNGDAAGKLFAEALTERARHGVAVYLIVDGLGTIAVPGEFFDEMRAAGVNILEYRPPAPWRRGWGLLRRNHRKLLAVDGRVGFAGGLNVGAEWLPEDLGGQGWHDVHVKVVGPAVRELSKLSLSTWIQRAGVNFDVRLFLPDVEPMGSTYVSIVGSRERKKRRAIRQSYLHAIRRARKYIYIANAYFLPGRGFRRALRNAVKRGVDVRVMVPARGDILPVQLASQALYGSLMRAGVKVFLWQQAVLHAKTAVIDDEWSTVGSFNIDHRSWAMNLEVNVNAMGPEFAGQLRQVFESDQRACEELSPVKWRRRPILLRLLEGFFYLFRNWM